MMSKEPQAPDLVADKLLTQIEGESSDGVATRLLAQIEQEETPDQTAERLLAEIDTSRLLKKIEEQFPEEVATRLLAQIEQEETPDQTAERLLKKIEKTISVEEKEDSVPKEGFGGAGRPESKDETTIIAEKARLKEIAERVEREKASIISALAVSLGRLVSSDDLEKIKERVEDLILALRGNEGAGEKTAQWWESLPEELKKDEKFLGALAVHGLKPDTFKGLKKKETTEVFIPVFMKKEAAPLPGPGESQKLPPPTEAEISAAWTELDEFISVEANKKTLVDLLKQAGESDTWIKRLRGAFSSGDLYGKARVVNLSRSEKGKDLINVLIDNKILTQEIIAQFERDVFLTDIDRYVAEAMKISGRDDRQMWDETFERVKIFAKDGKIDLAEAPAVVAYWLSLTLSHAIGATKEEDQQGRDEILARVVGLDTETVKANNKKSRELIKDLREKLKNNEELFKKTIAEPKNLTDDEIAELLKLDKKYKFFIDGAPGRWVQYLERKYKIERAAFGTTDTDTILLLLTKLEEGTLSEKEKTLLIEKKNLYQIIGIPDFSAAQEIPDKGKEKAEEIQEDSKLTLRGKIEQIKNKLSLQTAIIIIAILGVGSLLINQISQVDFQKAKEQALSLLGQKNPPTETTSTEWQQQSIPVWGPQRSVPQGGQPVVLNPVSQTGIKGEMEKTVSGVVGKAQEMQQKMENEIREFYDNLKNLPNDQQEMVQQKIKAGIVVVGGEFGLPTLGHGMNAYREANGLPYAYQWDDMDAYAQVGKDNPELAKIAASHGLPFDKENPTAEQVLAVSHYFPPGTEINIANAARLVE